MQQKYSILKLFRGFLLIAGLAISNMAFAQNALIIKDAAYIIIHGGGASSSSVRVIINQPDYHGINQATAGQGGIISEGEWNYIQWNIGTASGANPYPIPFVYYNGAYNQIPFSMKISSGGLGSGYVLLSTYHTPAALTPYATYDGATPIVNLNQEYSSPAVSDEAYMVNRWWIVDAESYSSSYTDFSNRPFNIVFNFGFTSGEQHSLGLGTLEAQPYEYNASKSKWDDAIVFNQTSSSSGPPAQVTATAVTNTNLFRAWVLVDKSKPLPIELLSFNAVCEGNIVSLNWTTATETNNDYFTVERSKDAQTWETVTMIPGAGNSNTTLYYNSTDNQPYPDYTYYRLKQTDYNGAFTYSNVVIAGCGNETPFNFISVSNSQGGGIDFSFTANQGESYTYALYDLQGKLLIDNSGKAVSGMNQVHINTQTFSQSIYILTLQSATKSFSKKIMLSDQY
jgi:hypothetical protein